MCGGGGGGGVDKLRKVQISLNGEILPQSVLIESSSNWNITKGALPEGMG